MDEPVTPALTPHIYMGEDGRPLVTAIISQFPGLPQTAVFHDVVSYERGKGHGTAAHSNRLAAAKRQGFKYALAAVMGWNHAEKKILRNAGWEKLGTLGSAHFELWGREL